MGIAVAVSGVTPVAHAADISQERFNARIVDARATMLSDPAAALTIAQSAHHEATALPQPVARDIALATSDWLEAEALNRLNDLDAATPLVNRALTSINKVDPRSKLKGEILLTIGSIAGARGQT
ncbi:MAG: hypothetical protein M3N02_07560, partial [Pseudomonadota bacterium]|nr:hypothetical protein [Pseudomonadota bacterium]